MRQKNFFFTYVGGKTKDYKSFKDYVNFDGCNTICEPFCGSCAFSFLNRDNINKFILNDKDTVLIEFLKDVRKGLFPDYLKYVENKILDYIDNNKPTKEWYSLRKSVTNNTNKYDRFLISTTSRGRFGLMEIDAGRNEPLLRIKNKLKLENYENILNFVKEKNIKFRNRDCLEIFNKVKDKKNTFVFLDPPYFESYNKSYCVNQINGKNEVIDNTKMYIDILEFLKSAKCKVMLIINKNALIEYLYKDYIKGEYTKQYDMSRRIVQHLIITNY